MVRFKLFLLLPTAFFFYGCLFPENSSTSSPSSDEVIHRERDISGKLALALGGVREGTDEISFDEPMQTLELQNHDSDLFNLIPRNNSPDFFEGKGAQVQPRQVGIGFVTPIINGRSRDPVEITIPPQKLIQIFLGEARGELHREATIAEDGSVKLSSISVTGDALGAVIRNRIHLINQKNAPGLFLATRSDYEKNPPLSYYEAVIEANNGLIYQFSPVDPADPSHQAYQQASFRVSVEANLLRAYDQAVLTASGIFAGIFNDQTQDSTQGSFAFYSPTPTQLAALQEVLQTGSHTLPEEGGISDQQFPALAPIQVVILKEVPSFVFIRSRNSLDPAVVEMP